MEGLFFSSKAAGMCATTVIVTAISIWALKMLNWLWLRPRRFERLLRAQGLNGDPYSLSYHNSTQTQTQQHDPKPQAFALSHDVAPRVPSSQSQTIVKYGKNSFLWEGTTPKVIIAYPEQIKKVFNEIHDFQKPKLSRIAKFLAAGLVTYEGEKWAKHRRIINPAFHLEKLKNMLPAFSQSCHDMISTWKGMLSSDGTCEIDVLPFLQNLTCDVISRTAFGSSYAEGAKIFQLLRMQGYLHTTRKYKNIPILRHLPSASNRKMKQNERDIHDLIAGIIKTREKDMEQGVTFNEDLLGILLASNRKEIQGHGNNRTAGMTWQEVIEECKLFYLAGQETTSTLLVWTMILLARYPEWQARARQEVFQVFGNQNPNSDGLSQLKIVTMILYEVLRLYPPIIFFSRTLQKDLKLGNLSLPAGVNVNLPILSVHHDHDIWGADAEEFKPERFSEGAAKATKGQVSFFPFGWGPRICIGQTFALLESKIVLSLLLQNLSFELSAAYVHAPTVMITLKPKHGAHLVLLKL